MFSLRPVAWQLYWLEMQIGNVQVAHNFFTILSIILHFLQAIQIITGQVIAIKLICQADNLDKK